MTGWLANGEVLDWILGGMVLEGAGLWTLHHFRGRGIAPGAVLPNLASGMCLLLAMRLALGGAWWLYVSISLLAALALHLTDLHRKWHRPKEIA